MNDEQNNERRLPSRVVNEYISREFTPVDTTQGSGFDQIQWGTLTPDGFVTPQRRIVNRRVMRCVMVEYENGTIELQFEQGDNDE